MKKAKDVDSYIATFPPPAQKILKQVRQTIKKAAPDAEELISYQMPAYRQNGMLVFFAGYKNHIGFYPTSSGIAAFKNEFAKFKWSKGAVQFPINKPMPVKLISRIVKYKLKENLEKEQLKKNITKKKSPETPGKENYIKYHNDGTLWAKGTMTGGQLDGYWQWFRKDGVIMRSGYFTNGKQAGEWTTYDKKGKVFKVTKMK